MHGTDSISTSPRVCFFQAYYTDYIRSQTLLEGLSAHNVRLSECIVNQPSPVRYLKALFKLIKMLKRTDVILANFRCWEILPVLRLLTRKPIIYDAHISIWQSYCEERRKCRPDSLLGKLLFRIDSLNCRLSDLILIDTRTHADYFSETFGIPSEKFLPVYISCEESIFQPVEHSSSSSSEVSRLFWSGSGIPLQGLNEIYDAMKLMKDLPVHLRIAGSSEILDGLKAKAQREDISSITFLGRIPRKQIVTEIAESDICLGGHYSSIPKAANVIAGKLFEMIAMKKAVIAGDSKAVRELFTHRESVYLCRMGSAESLAEAITELIHSPELRDKLALNSYNIYNSRLRPEHLTENLYRRIVSLTQ